MDHVKNPCQYVRSLECPFLAISYSNLVALNLGSVVFVFAFEMFLSKHMIFITQLQSIPFH